MNAQEMVTIECCQVRLGYSKLRLTLTPLNELQTYLQHVSARDINRHFPSRHSSATKHAGTTDDYPLHKGNQAFFERLEGSGRRQIGPKGA